MEMNAEGCVPSVLFAKQMPVPCSFLQMHLGGLLMIAQVLGSLPLRLMGLRPLTLTWLTPGDCGCLESELVIEGLSSCLSLSPGFLNKQTALSLIYKGILLW